MEENTNNKANKLVNSKLFATVLTVLSLGSMIFAGFGIYGTYMTDKAYEREGFEYFFEAEKAAQNGNSCVAAKLYYKSKSKFTMAEFKTDLKDRNAEKMIRLRNKMWHHANQEFMVHSDRCRDFSINYSSANQ